MSELTATNGGAAEMPESDKALPFIPRNIGEALETARILLTAKAVPESLTKDRGRDLPKDEIVSKVIAVIMAGAEVGMGPMGAVANIALVNQRRMIWGQGAVGLLQRSGQLESYKVEQIGPAPTSKQTTAQFSDDFGVRVTLKRRGQPIPYVGEYTVGKAKRAHLWMNTYKKPWIESPERQMQWRAFHIPATDGFSDILMGLSIREVAEDFEHEVPPHPGEDFFKEDTPAPYGPPGALPPPTETPLTSGGAQASAERAEDAVVSADDMSYQDSVSAPVASREAHRTALLRPIEYDGDLAARVCANHGVIDCPTCKSEIRPETAPVVGEHAVRHGERVAPERSSNAVQGEGGAVSGSTAPNELKVGEPPRVREPISQSEYSSAFNPSPPPDSPNPGRASSFPQERRSTDQAAVTKSPSLDVPNPGLAAPAPSRRSSQAPATQPALPMEVPVVADHGRRAAGDAPIAEVVASPKESVGSTDALPPAVGEAAEPSIPASPPSDSGGEETFWTIAARSGNYELEISNSEKPPMTAGRLRFLASTATQQSALSKFTEANLSAIEVLPKTLRDGVESAIKRQMNKLTTG